MGGINKMDLAKFADGLYGQMSKIPLEEQRRVCYRLNYKVTQAFKEKGLAPHSASNSKKK